jgi:hypothetical protein
MASFPVVFDPAMLVFSGDLSREEFTARVRFLASWARLARSGDIQVRIPGEVRSFFIRNGYYPAHSALAETIESLDLRFRYAPEDVIRPLSTILDRSSADAYCCVRDEVHITFVSEPPQPWCSDPRINGESQRSLILSTIETRIHGRGAIAFASQLNSGRLSFTATIEIVDPDSVPEFTPADLPKLLDGDGTVVADLDGLLDSFLAERLWSEAIDNLGVRSAIRMRCREKLKDTNSYQSMADIPEFFVGADFYASLIRIQAGGVGRFASVTLEACACAVLSLATLDWKAFRKANRKVDGAEPLRAHVTEGGLGLRLMAWRRPTPSGGVLEFANVGEKWEEEISYADPSGAV